MNRKPNILICIPTTQGPSLVTSLSHIEDASSLVADRRYEEPDYPMDEGILNSFRELSDLPTGRINRLYGRKDHYVCQISRKVDTGESIQLALAVAQALFLDGKRLFMREGHSQRDAFFDHLCQSGQPTPPRDGWPDEVWWLTGELDNPPRYEVLGVTHIPEKITASGPLFDLLQALRIPIRVFLKDKSGQTDPLKKMLTEKGIQEDAIHFVGSLFDIPTLPKSSGSNSGDLADILDMIKRHPWYASFAVIAPVFGFLTWLGWPYKEICSYVYQKTSYRICTLKVETQLQVVRYFARDTDPGCPAEDDLAADRYESRSETPQQSMLATDSLNNLCWLEATFTRGMDQPFHAGLIVVASKARPGEKVVYAGISSSDPARHGRWRINTRPRSDLETPTPQKLFARDGSYLFQVWLSETPLEAMLNQAVVALNNGQTPDLPVSPIVYTKEFTY